MNPATLIEQIKTQMRNEGFKETEFNTKLIEILSKAIIEHIQTQATIQVVTTGSATTQSGTGTIK